MVILCQMSLRAILTEFAVHLLIVPDRIGNVARHWLSNLSRPLFSALSCHV